MKRTVFFTIAICSTVFLAATAEASLINVDFGTDNNTTTHGGSNSTVYSGDAVVGASGDIWNGTTALSGTFSLVNSTGVTSGATMTYSGSNMYCLGASFDGTTYKALMDDYFIPSSGSTFATITGLTAGVYNLYIYSSADKTDREASFTATTSVGNSSATIGPNANSVGTFKNEEGVTWEVLHVTVGDNGVLALSSTKISGSEIDINGFQLQSVPEPATMATLLIGLFGLLAYAWQKQRR